MSLDRVEKLLKNAGGKILVGGVDTINKQERYLSPTIIRNPNRSAQIMTEEIFGPILPIITYSNFDEALRMINEGEKPLAIYYQGNPSSKNFRRLQEETSSGNLTANDVLHHTIDTEAGFGGVGHSGYGRIGGYESFKNFSNPKSINIKY
jgi:acyl-CoA reductase-like NAD-dependent aldehyde dehydrogenase